MQRFATLLLVAIITWASPAIAIGERPAPDFPRGLDWVNVDHPLTMKELHGKVLVLDFWTYGCSNCLHVIPELQMLEKEFGNQIAVIGVHSPKFDNEKNIKTLRKMVVRLRRDEPIVNDVDFKLFRQYGAHAWPTIVVVDPEGKIVGGVTGEDNYDILEATVKKLLKEYEGEINTDPLPLKLEKEKYAKTLLAAPEKIAVSDEYVAIADTLHNRVLITNHLGKLLHVIGGREAGDADGDGKTVRFSAPRGLAFAKNGLYVADTGNHKLRFIDFSDWHTRTVAGNGDNKRYRSGEFDAASIGMSSPWGLSYEDGKLYIAMAGAHQIWLYNESGHSLKLLAGRGDESLRDGSLRRAAFSQPSGVSLLGDKLFVADAEDSAIREIDLKEKQVKTLVGEGLFEWGDVDGEFNKAQIQHPAGIAAIDDTHVYIADSYNHRVKLLDLEKGTIKSLVGTGKPEEGLGVGNKTGLDEPTGLAILNGQILIADTNNDRILKLNPSSGQATEWKITE